MASNSPSNADLMTILNKINNRLESVEKKLNTLDLLEKKCSVLRRTLRNYGVVFMTKTLKQKNCHD